MSTERLSQWQDRTFFFLEALIVFGLFWADIHHWRHVVIFSKTPYLFVLGWISLRVRGAVLQKEPAAEERECRKLRCRHRLWPG